MKKIDIELHGIDKSFCDQPECDQRAVGALLMVSFVSGNEPFVVSMCYAHIASVLRRFATMADEEEEELSRNHPAYHSWWLP